MEQVYQVKLPTFEGPLDLLLHLVNELEIDIYDIPVAEITAQYIQYINEMKKIELNIASEYLVMAATLLEIKSATLLPKQSVIVEDNYEEDPREVLISRLIEYKKYKDAANVLKAIELNENELFTCPPLLFTDLDSYPAIVENGASVYDMLTAIGNMMQRKRWRQPMLTTIHRVELSIEERITELVTLLEGSSTALRFEQLFPYPERSHIVTTFLAILQLLKMQSITCEQANHFAPIYVAKMEDK